ncbi:MAG: hypothetical protein HZA52_13170 [Planctomycetes bacterium]|nr:hypothetical protein [Planctomycetota bacterium]
MTEESLASQSSAAGAVCSGGSHVGRQKECALCNGPVCSNCGGLADGRRVCTDCFAKLEKGVLADLPKPTHVLGAWAIGALGALIGGAVWALVAIAFDLELGYLAIGVGMLAGYGVFLGAGKKRGRSLQFVAVGCAVLGLVLGKYLIVAHVFVTEYPELVTSYVDPALFETFSDNLGEFFSGYDVLWFALAIGASIRFTAPQEQTLTAPRQARQ